MWRALQEVGSDSEPPETDYEDFNTSNTINTENASVDICQIGAIPFNFNAHQNRSEVFQISIEQIDRYLNKDSKPRTNPANKLHQEYHEYLNIFNREAAKKLPDHRPYNYKIELEGNLKFGHSPLRGIGKPEL